MIPFNLEYVQLRLGCDNCDSDYCSDDSGA